MAAPTTPTDQPLAEAGGTPRTLVRDQRLTSAQRGWALMLAAGLLAGLANLVVLRADAPSAQVLMVVGAHPPGTPLDEVDLRPVEVAAEDPMDLRLVTPEVLDGLGDVVTTTALADGEVLRLGDLDRPDDDGRSAMSLPVPAGRAAGGALQVGDLVHVVADVGEGATVVAQALEVLDVSRPDGGLAGATDSLTVTVAVEDRDILPLASALRSDAIDLVRAGSAERRAGSRSTAPAATGAGTAGG